MKKKVRQMKHAQEESLYIVKETEANPEDPSEKDASLEMQHAVGPRRKEESLVGDQRRNSSHSNTC